MIERAARPNGLFGILRTVADTAALTDELCDGGPDVLGAIGAEMIIGDQMEPASGLLAAHLGLPFVSIAAALPIDPDPAIPLPFLPWPYDPSEKGLKRNRGGEQVARLLLTRQRQTLRRWSERSGISPRETLADCLSPSATIAQTVPSFDFPRPPEPRFQAVGPIRLQTEVATDLPFALDPERPLVFASLGTLQGHRVDIFRSVAKACRDLGAQCLVAHCGRLDASEAASIDADVVTDFAPQQAVLRRAAVCVTHAGLNTVMDSLEAGVPLLAIPIAFDQPGIAARIVHHGVGERLSRRFLTAAKLRASLERLLARPNYRNRARAIGLDIRASGGASLAADIIEKASGDIASARR